MSFDGLSFDEHHTPDVGVVIRKSTGVYTVQTPRGVLSCAASGLLWKQLEGYFQASASTNIRRRVKAVHEIKQVDPIAIGDRVRFQEADPSHPGGQGLIVEVLPRRSALSRLAAGPRPREQVIVANADLVIAVFSVRDPAPKWNLLDRYLVSAESSGLPTLICMTKIDLLDGSHDDDLHRGLADYERIGYPVLLTSAETGAGIDALSAALAGKLAVLVGKSGVGKTSLLNAIEPELGLRVSAVSRATSKGRHTTTHLEMFPLASGGAVVDTPGMREFGLWGSGGDLAAHFPEMQPYLGQCRFGVRCHHRHEPGCAIKQAVEAGAISARRYDSFLRLLDD